MDTNPATVSRLTNFDTHLPFAVTESVPLETSSVYPVSEYIMYGRDLASIVESVYAPVGVAGGVVVVVPGLVGPSPFPQADSPVTANTATAVTMRHNSGMRLREGLISIVVPCVLSALGACSGGKDATAPDPGGTPGVTTVDVFTPGLVFSPAFVTIGVGSTVRFNIAGVAHDVTFQAVTGAPASVPVTAPTAVVSRTFNTKGTFPYDCRTHPGMSGSVTVQ